jgi:hypothetical protein
VEMEDPSDMQVRFFSFLFVNFRQTKILRDWTNTRAAWFSNGHFVSKNWMVVN